MSCFVQINNDRWCFNKNPSNVFQQNTCTAALSRGFYSNLNYAFSELTYSRSVNNHVGTGHQADIGLTSKCQLLLKVIPGDWTPLQANTNHSFIFLLFFHSGLYSFNVGSPETTRQAWSYTDR